MTCYFNFFMKNLQFIFINNNNKFNTLLNKLQTMFSFVAFEYILKKKTYVKV